MIRKAELKDIGPLVEIGKWFHAESEHFSRCNFSPMKLFFFFKGLLSNADAMLDVIERDGVVVGGMAALTFSDFYSTDKLATDICLFILPEYRGGLEAFRLIERYKSWAKERGAKFSLISISTGINMERTQGLYEKLGARYIGPVLVID